MKISINRYNLSDLLVYLAVVIFVAINLVSITFFSIHLSSFINHILSLFSLSLLLGYELLVKKFDIRSLVGLLVFSLLGVLMFLSTRSFPNYLYTLAFVFLLRHFSFEKLVKVILPLTIAFLLVTILSSKVGIIRDYVEITTTRTRHYLGFTYSLFPSTIMLNITGLYLIYKKEKISLLNLTILAISIVWIFLQTNSRLTFISSLLLVLVGFTIRYYPVFWEKIRFILLLLIPSYIYAPILSYILVKKYITASSWLLALNKFLGNRLYLASKSISLYGFDWLGKNIRWVGNGLNALGQRSTGTYLYVDNLYMQLLQRYGLLFLIIFVVLLTLVLVLLYKRKQYLLLVIMVLLAYHMTIDDLTFQLHYNSFLLLIGLPFSTYIVNKRI